jgi:hypothetical protein
MELHIRANDLAKVKHRMQANQPTVTGLNSAGIIEVASGLVCTIEPDPDRSAEFPFRVVVLPRGRASLTVVNSDTGQSEFGWRHKTPRSTEVWRGESIAKAATCVQTEAYASPAGAQVQRRAPPTGKWRGSLLCGAFSATEAYSVASISLVE